MKVEVAPFFAETKTRESKILCESRVTALLGGIDMLKVSLWKQTADPEFRQSRDLEHEKRIANAINTRCNCHGKDKFSSPTFFDLIATELGDPIISKDRAGKCGKEQLLVMSRFVFFGMVQGDEKEPWIKTSDENNWYLHFGEEMCDYYAPIADVTKLSISAYKF